MPRTTYRISPRRAPAIIACLACCAVAAGMPAPVLPSGDAGRHTTARSEATRFIGFEQNEGYSVGPIGTQNGWSEFGVSAGAGTSIASLGRDSAQSLFLTDNRAVQNGTFVGGLSPELDDPGERGVFTIDTRIDDRAGASYTIIGQSLELFGINFRLVFEFGGTMFVFDETPSGFRFVDTNVFFDLGEWREVRVEWEAGATRYFYDDRLIYTSTSERFARGVDQVVLASDGWQDAGFPVGDGPVGAYFDNLRLDVPTPPTLAIALAGLGACRRRRRYADRDACAPPGRQVLRVA